MFLHGCKSLKTLSLPDTVTKFETNTFEKSYIESLVIGNGISVLPRLCCPTLKYITLPDELTTLSTNCFEYANIESIILPAGVTTIPANAFRNSKIQTVTAMGTITEIGERAFYNCTNLKSLDISAVTNIGEYAFYHTNFDITLSEVLTTYDTNAFSQSCGNITIGEGFTLTKDLSLIMLKLNNDNILAFLKSLPDMTDSSKYTITITPTYYNPVFNSNYGYYSIIKSKKINTTGDELTWDEDTGDMTVDEYVTSKNITLK